MRLKDADEVADSVEPDQSVSTLNTWIVTVTEKMPQILRSFKLRAGKIHSLYPTPPPPKK